MEELQLTEEQKIFLKDLNYTLIQKFQKFVGSRPHREDEKTVETVAAFFQHLAHLDVYPELTRFLDKVTDTMWRDGTKAETLLHLKEEREGLSSGMRQIVDDAGFLMFSTAFLDAKSMFDYFETKGVFLG